MTGATRRRFLGQTAAGGAALLTGAGLGSRSAARQDSPVTSHGDGCVVVCGGGPAGIVAATQAARAGSKTLLVEKNGMLGGTTTSGGVNFPGLFHAWGKQIIAGIGWELVSRCAHTCREPLPDFSVVPERHWQHQVRVDRAVYAALADELVLEAGADILLHAMPASVQNTPDGYDLVVCTKTGLRTIHAKVIIDCTGDANVLSMAGCETVRHEQLQPGTLMLRLSGYDLASLDKPRFIDACNQAIREGLLKQADCPAGPSSVWRLLANRGDNSLDVLGVDGRTSEGRTAAELAARASLLRLYRFMRAQPGLGNLKIDFMAPECGIRETVTIKAHTTVTAEDYAAGKVWPDAVCYSFYPIDWHRADGQGIDMRHLNKGKVATIPRAALIPAAKANLIAAGRCIASDQLANSALRVQATCMAVGQAAGAMAHLAANRGIAPADVNIQDIQALLKQHAAIVPEPA